MPCPCCGAKPDADRPASPPPASARQEDEDADTATAAGPPLPRIPSDFTLLHRSSPGPDASSRSLASVVSTVASLVSLGSAGSDSTSGIHARSMSRKELTTTLAQTRERRILHAGFLRKKKYRKNWKTRWCVIEPGRITYFRGKKGDKELPSGYVNLDHNCRIDQGVDARYKAVDTKDPEFQHAFVLHTDKTLSVEESMKGKEQKEHPTFFFAAMSGVEKEIWVIAFNAAIGDDGASLSLCSVLKESPIDETPMSRLEIYASLCCFRVQRKFIHRVKREQTHALVTERIGRKGLAGGGLQANDRSAVGWKRIAEETHWPLLVGWMLKKGTSNDRWERRWFVVFGPFLLYYLKPEHHITNELLNLSKLAKAPDKLGFIFLQDFEPKLTTFDQIQAGHVPSSPSKKKVLNGMAESSKVCLTLTSLIKNAKWSAERGPLTLDHIPNSPHRYEDWLRALQQATHLASTFKDAATAVQQVLRQCTTRFDHDATENVPRPPMHLLVSDAAIAPAFGATHGEDLAVLLEGLTKNIFWPKGIDLKLTDWRRELVRMGALQGVDQSADSEGHIEKVFVLLFEDLLLILEPKLSKNKSVDDFSAMRYKDHQQLTSETVLAELSSGFEFAVTSGPRSYKFHAPDLHTNELWVQDLSQLLLNRDAQQNAIERFKGAVIFADVSGFSNLGDALERRELQEQKVSGGSKDGGAGATAAEELARILGQEIQKMVEAVTRGGGDVIKFAGDCVIAVFPEQDYQDLKAAKKYSALTLATGQAVRVSVQMMHAKNLFILKQEQMLGSIASEGEGLDEISKLISKLNIHIAIGAAETFGYHVGGVDNKWDFLISGKVMDDVRSADKDAKAGEVVLHKDAFQLLHDKNNKRIKMRHTVLPSGNVKLETYFGPTEEPKFQRPWETFKHDAQMSAKLADKLTAYVPKPVIDQVEAGNTLWLSAKRRISTIFCRLIGIDYKGAQGSKAVMQLGEIVTQVQNILKKTQGTLTRVISDDKGTSMLMAFDHPQHAVDAAMEIQARVAAIPGGRYRTASGITTGLVYIGPVGGRIRAEFTMHGSIVNFSARLMTCPVIKNAGGILCDEETVRLATKTVFAAQAPRHFKGFTEDIVSYMPTQRRQQDAHFEWVDSDDDEIEGSRKQTGQGNVAATSTGHSSHGRSTTAGEIWSALLRPFLEMPEGSDEKNKRGVIVLVETDLPGHWGVHDIVRAVQNFRRQVRVSNICFNSSDQALNKKELTNLIETAHTTDECFVLEEANVLDEENWKLLYELCEQVIPADGNPIRGLDGLQDMEVTETIGANFETSIFVVCIDRPSGHEDSHTPLNDEHRQLMKSPMVIHKQVHFAAKQDELGHVGVAEEITLEVAAVVAAASTDTESTKHPKFRTDLVKAAHPFSRIKNHGAWSADVLQQHLRSLTTMGILRMTKEKLFTTDPSGCAEYEFVDAAVQRERYLQILHENRSPIHLKSIDLLRKIVKAAGRNQNESVASQANTSTPSSETELTEQLYAQLQFHYECIGDTMHAQACASHLTSRAGVSTGANGTGAGKVLDSNSMKVVKLCEAQRRFNGLYSSEHLLEGDPSPWTSDDGSETRQSDDAAVLPPAQGAYAWRWASEWVKDVQTNATDGHGWAYGTSFRSYFCTNTSGGGAAWTHQRSAVGVVRCRVWFRIAQRFALATDHGRPSQPSLTAPEARMVYAQLLQNAGTPESAEGSVEKTRVIGTTSVDLVGLTSREPKDLSEDETVVVLEIENGKLQRKIASLQGKLTQFLTTDDHDMLNQPDVGHAPTVQPLTETELLASRMAQHQEQAHHLCAQGKYAEAKAELSQADTAVATWTAHMQSLLAEVRSDIDTAEATTSPPTTAVSSANVILQADAGRDQNESQGPAIDEPMTSVAFGFEKLPVTEIDVQDDQVLAPDDSPVLSVEDKEEILYHDGDTVGAPGPVPGRSGESTHHLELLDGSSEEEEEHHDNKMDMEP